jgi:hypothetical protein
VYLSDWSVPAGRDRVIFSILTSAPAARTAGIVPEFKAHRADTVRPAAGTADPLDIRHGVEVTFGTDHVDSKSPQYLC